MQTTEAAPRWPISRRLLSLCFVASGATALIYELVWLRRLQLVFGSTTYSLSATIAAFMAGLGLGSWWIGRRVDRRGKGIATYAVLELALAGYALVSLPLLALVHRLYALLQAQLQLDHFGASLLKLVLAFPVLTVPAFLMGGTLPALVRGVLARRGELDHALGRLYGLNTLGAALGTLVCGALLIEHLGLLASVLLCAAVNATIGLLVLRVLRRQTGKTGKTEQAPSLATEPAALKEHLRLPAVRYSALAIALTGMLSLGYEVVYTRLLTLLFGSSAYAFTIVLTIFLVGIAIGALLYARWSRSHQPRPIDLAGCLLVLGTWVTATIALLPLLPRTLLALAQLTEVGFVEALVYQILFALLLLLLPTVVFGIALPLAIGAVARTLGQIGRDIGGLYLTNTAAGIIGSTLTGFLLIPLLGTQGTLILWAGLNLTFAAAGLARFGQGWLARLALPLACVPLIVVAVGHPPWPAVLYDGGLGHRLDRMRADSRVGRLQKLHRSPTKLLMLREGLNATISVRQYRDKVSLLLNGKADASTGSDMGTQTMAAAIPLLIHQAPTDLAVIGWGTGVTVHTATLVPQVQRIDAIEIEAAVLEASRFFHTVNDAAEQHPKVNVVIDDARSFFVASDRRYDVIISEPTNPWITGLSALFSTEFHRLVQRRLKPNGLFAQWLQLYALDARTLALVLRTALHSFEHVQLWFTDRTDLLLLASQQPIRVSPDRITFAYQRAPRLTRLIAAYGPGPDPGSLLGCFLLPRALIERVVLQFPHEILSDDAPVLEYRALRELYRRHHDHLEALLRLKLAQGAMLPPLEPGADQWLLSQLARAGVARLMHRKPSVALALLGPPSGGQRAPQGRMLVRRAETLLRLNRHGEAEALIGRLPAASPWREEAALLRAELALLKGDPRAASRELEAMGSYRPTARLQLAMAAAIAAADADRALAAARALIEGLREAADADALRLRAERMHALYEEIDRLAQQSGRDRDLIALLEQPAAPGGEYARLLALVGTRSRAGYSRSAAEALSELRRFRIVAPPVLTLCERAFAAAGRLEEAQRCGAEWRALVSAPPGIPLWP